MKHFPVPAHPIHNIQDGMKTATEREVWVEVTVVCGFITKLCLTLCDPMDCPPGSSVHGISQARILEWAAISFSRGSSQPRDQTCVSSTGRRIATGLVQDAVIVVEGPVRDSREPPAE